MKKRIIALAVSGALTAVIMIVMNVRLIPDIEKGTQSMRFFDMNSFGYTPAEAEAFLSEMSVYARGLVLRVQLPLDFVYPVAYTVFFVLLIRALAGRKTALAAVPALLFVADYTENICTEIMMRSAPLSYTLARFASSVTVAKSMLMYAVFAIIIVLAVRKLAGRKKRSVEVS